MDTIVAQAMARWPDVPSVYGWLRLDRRGRWLIRNEPISHRTTCEFIGRNYAWLRDGDGKARFYFQNGPQRVFVDVDHCPYVLHLAGSGGNHLCTHTGIAVAAPQRAWLDAEGGIVIEFEHGVGSVLDRDLPALAEQVSDSAGRRLDTADWLQALDSPQPQLQLTLGERHIPLGRLAPGSCAAHFGFDPAPRPEPGEDACV